EKFSLDHVYSHDNRTLVPDKPIHVKSIEAERLYDVTSVTEFLYPYLYTIKLEYAGSHEWTIYKRYKDFHKLHKKLLDYAEKETQQSIEALNRSQEENKDRPYFPTRNERLAFVTDKTINQRSASLMKYLNTLLQQPNYIIHPAVSDFLEISYITFVHGLDVSRKEGYLHQQLPTDEYHGWKRIFHIPFIFDTWKFGQENWFVVKDTYLTYINPTTHSIRTPFLVDNAFKIETDLKHVRTKDGIKVTNSQRSLILKCKDKYHKQEWTNILQELIQKNSTTFCRGNQFNSFVPMREQQLGQWFMNGKGYMEAVAKAIMKAKEEIYITDWWLSPELWLIRPGDKPIYRLDNLLEEKADEGVRIYVMLFKEMELALGIKSAYSEKILTSKNKENIKVIRHPDHFITGGISINWLWSHHEKCVIIDQKLAFIGGIDLCYGRWDDDEMKLVDLGNENILELKTAGQLAADKTTSKTDESTTNDEIIAKNSPVPTDGDIDANSKKAEVEIPDVNAVIPKKEWSKSVLVNIGIQIVNYLLFILRYFSIIFQQKPDKHGGSEEEKEEEHQVKKLRDWLKLQRKMMKKKRSNDENEILLLEDKEENESAAPAPRADVKYFIGKDYSNSYVKDFENLEDFSADFIQRKDIVRTPWHDEALVVAGEVARDAARHFIQRWNTHKREKYLYDDSYPFLLPKTYNNKEELTVNNWSQFLNTKPIQINAQ
ncbi:unnamed protein product, partial [Didymodactylos carnosus]